MSIYQPVRDLMRAIVRGELHPLDGAREIVRYSEICKESQRFAAFVDPYEFHLEQPKIIKQIIAECEALLDE